ncbi:MAG: hypothetical protein DI629_05680 [Mesorhizobium amorphae]|nr:MAG: hypothetical protein DI629_05680 [Mesorhizobium amorphae]
MASLEQTAGFFTALLLYIMLAVPFFVWSARASLASARSLVDGRMRGRPGRGTTIFLCVLPLLFVIYHVVSGIVATEQSEWSAYAFLALSPACGMIAGYLLGWLWAQNGGPGVGRWGQE